MYQSRVGVAWGRGETLGYLKILIFITECCFCESKIIKIYTHKRALADHKYLRLSL